MQFDIHIYKLSDKFIEDHPSDEYPEIATKSNRPHCCLLIDTHRDYFICIPYRSHIHHKNAYLFHDSDRSRRDHSGLDYTKIAIINNTDYFSTEHARVDNDEYRETLNNSKHIVADAVKYVDRYIEHMNGSAPLSPEKFERAYKYTTLKYYHDILGIGGQEDQKDSKLAQHNIDNSGHRNVKVLTATGKLIEINPDRFNATCVHDTTYVIDKTNNVSDQLDDDDDRFSN